MLAIFHYYYNQIQQRMTDVRNEGLSPRAQFEKQLQTQFEEIQEHQAFIIMHMKEMAVPFNKDIAAFAYRMRAESNAFFRENLLLLYGDQAAPYVHDLTMILQGIISGCFELIILNASTDAAHLSRYVTRRLDDIFQGLRSSREEPLLHQDIWAKFQCPAVPGQGPDSATEEDKASLLAGLEQAAAKFRKQSDGEHLTMTLELLKQEMEAPHPRLPLIEGMLHNLGAYAHLHGLRDDIRRFYKIIRRE